MIAVLRPKDALINKRTPCYWGRRAGRRWNHPATWAEAGLDAEKILQRGIDLVWLLLWDRL
jgi:hypothetical protein